MMLFGEDVRCDLVRMLACDVIWCSLLASERSERDTYRSK